MNLRERYYRRRKFVLTIACLAGSIVWGYAPHALAVNEVVAVLYPQLPSPEQRIFTLIRAGVRTSAEAEGARVVEIEIAEKDTAATLTERIQRVQASHLVVLGRRAYEISAKLERAYPMWVSAIDLPIGPNIRTGTNLFPDPAQTFSTLRLLAPNVRRVIAVIDPQRSAWLVKPAQLTAQAAGLTLVIHEAQTVSQGASILWNILRYGNPHTDALWLLQGQFATPEVFRHLVEESWTRQFILFSNVLEHANEGALFALYPNPQQIGARAGREVLQLQRASSGILFLDEVSKALNTRIASHLGLDLPPKVSRQFDLILGER